MAQQTLLVRRTVENTKGGVLFCTDAFKRGSGFVSSCAYMIPWHLTSIKLIQWILHYHLHKER